MRSISRLAVTAAALLVGATALVASEESVRKLHVVEKPDDLAVLYADAQGIVTYDSMSGRFYFPSLGLSFDPVTSMFCDPDSKKYLDTTLRGEYSYSEMDGMYHHEDGILCFDPAKRMSFYSDRNLYWTDGMFFVWDSQFNMLRDPISGDYYDHGLGTFMSYNASLDMFYDKNAEQYYDPRLGLYYDEGMGMFFDPICGRFYDRDAQMYYDPDTGNASIDADGAFYFDSSANAYYNEKDGCWYCYDDATELYIDQTSFGGMGMMMGMGSYMHYYDPETEFHFTYDGCYYTVDETGDLYDPCSQCFCDTYSFSYYRYDSVAGGFVEAMSGMSYTPYWMETGCYAWRPSDGSTPEVDMSNMVYDYGMGMYYDNYYMLYYDADDGMYFDGMSYYREPWGDSYWYDSISQCYVNCMTGEHYVPSQSQSPSSSQSVDLSRMSYDSMMDLYYDSNSGLYYDTKISMYTDFMCYYLKPWGDCYYYDAMQNAYVCYMTGDVYYPHPQSVGTSGSKVQELTDEQIAEIQSTFMALEYMMKFPGEWDETETSPVDAGTYSAAPFSFADALWFRELLDDGMSVSDKRIWLRPGMMPGTIEVGRSDPWTTGDVEDSESTGVVVSVPESVWNSRARTVSFILAAGWNSSPMSGLSLMHDCWSSIGHYDDMGNYVMTGVGMGCQELSDADHAIYNRYQDDWDMLNFLVRASYGGLWSVSTVYGSLGMMAGVPLAIGGLQDMDGDGLSDLDEIKYGTNPFMADTDGDGLNDALELRIGSSPTMYDCDTDYDGMADVWERYFGLNPDNPVDANADPDHDGLNNQRECWLGTNPLSMDTDGDGLNDREEIKAGTQPCNPDTDNDQLPDGAEVARGTNLLNPDTDLDGLPDGREVGLGLDPLSVDTDCDGIADCDEVEYRLLGMSVAEKESSEIATRLRNWLPTDIEDLESDIDNDGTPDWVEYLGGGEPGGEFDVFEGTDGFPSVYVMTVDVEAENLPRPLMLECNGEKVCVSRSCSIQRFCEEGTWHNLRVVGVQGASVKVTVSYDDPRYAQTLVVTEDPQNLTGNSRLPIDSFVDQHVARELKFCQPTVEIVDERICFHGTGMNPQMKKTVTAKIVPEGFLGEFAWWTGTNEELREDDVVEGRDVNVFRENVGSKLFCSIRFMMDMRLDGAFRVTQMPITECTRKDKDAQQAEWCDIHNCEVRCCREKNILDCTEMGMNSFTINDLPKSKVYGGIGGNEIITGDGFESENEEGRPYYANKYARYSIPVNSDDDNSNGIEDFNETGYSVVGEDDLRPIPLAPDHGECCSCHKEKGQVEVTGISGDIRLWMDEDKNNEVGNWPYSIHTKVYVEGMAPSSEPDDATISCVAHSDDPNEEVENILHQFTIYSLRLLPDLNKDDLVDLKDAKLVHDMKELGLGWCLSPRVPSVLRLNVDVNMPGDVTLIVRGTGGEGTIRVYTSDPYSELKKECLHSLDKDNLTEVAGNGYAVKKLNAGDIPRSAANFMWVEVSDPGVSGSIEVVYEGTDKAEGYECHAKIKFQTLDFRIAGDGGVRDGKIDFKDPNDTNIVFWVNDDYDVLHNNLEEDMWQEDDDDKLLNYRRNCDDDVIGAIQGKDSLNQNSALDNYQASPKTIYCLRDLEDFDRLHLKLGKQLLTLKNRFVCEVRIDPLDEPEAENPAINLFPALASDQFYLMKNDKDIDDEHVIEEQMKTKRLATADSNERWQMLDISKCHREKAGECERVCFLYEGKESGMGFLTVRVKIGNVVLASTSLRMDLHPASKFIDTYEIEESNETNRPDIDEMKLKVGPVVKTPAEITFPGTTDKDRVVLTLGWNVKPFEKKAWRDTVFKRLFWQGYRGRVGTLMWPTTYNFDVKFKSLVTKNGFDAEGFETTVRSLADASNYDRGDHRAWLSGVRAANYFSREIQKLKHITFLVHSQGNVLMGEMLRRMQPEIKGKITYVALQGAISAQLYTRNFMPNDKYSSYNLKAFGMSGALDWAGRWLHSVGGIDSPDIFGYYPYGRKSDPPYLNNVLNGLWHTVNFYNRNDYALNIWLGNNGTKPDNLKGVRRNDRSFGFTTDSLFGCPDDADAPYELFTPTDKKTGWILDNQYGRFYQNRDIGRKTLGLFSKSDKVAIYPGNVENSTVDGDEYSLFDNKDTPSSDSGAAPAKWCVFSFVTQSRSLAIGQLAMYDYFKDSIDLQNYEFGFDHYFHSKEFRSNCRDMWKLWSEIHKHITAPKDSKRKDANK